ncbi:hypothetical protein D910_08106 [Dendroctonus ponderosae]|uniref:PROP1-like PPR domain-containing protein n=1 Tax=Dendroctonus ponderosae TaxID=77166 RepID=U4U9Z0_DENPD|nr:hypothetical protein D910_08106 [Dendroctonus ponderosae]
MLSTDVTPAQYKGPYERKQNFEFPAPFRDKRFRALPPGESEREFLVRAKMDPDSFGEKLEETEEDAGDLEEERHIGEQPLASQRLSTKQYATIIKDFLRQRKIKEAIDVLEVKMLKEDRVKPENYIYNLVLGGCGRVGYTKKAFQLYNNMKKRALTVTAGTYTALFNACSNSPWPADGLARANQLYGIMQEKGYTPNDTNYNAMIKAFGRCGDLQMAFALVDQMREAKLPLRDDTVSFLLQSCISDKEAGFRHALLVWRKLTEKRVKPTIYSFNLLLRCVRDCGLGDLEATKQVMEKLLNVERAQLALVSGADQTALIAKGTDGDVSDLRPNLLAAVPHLGSVLSISEVKNPEDRLLLLGGCQGFIETMLLHKCAPDIKTFTLLLDSLPKTTAAEKELIVTMKKLNIRPDVDFYNMLMKKRNPLEYAKGLRRRQAGVDTDQADEDAPRSDHVRSAGVGLHQQRRSPGLGQPNEPNWLHVSTRRRGGFEHSSTVCLLLNAAILGAMLRQACVHMEFDYIFEVMELCLRECVPVNKMFLDHLHSFKKSCRHKQNAKELSHQQVRKFGVFKNRLETWLTEVQIDEAEDAHPWQQFRQNYPDEVRFKPKDSARFKARHTSRFKVKTSSKHRRGDW